MTSPDVDNAGERTFDCTTCGELGAIAYGTEKAGWPEHTVRLPDAASRLETVREIENSGGRKKILQRCPTCGDHFLYRLDYEFLAGGSEDDESLRRLTRAEADELR